ncbi:MAG: hypothetical protein M9901_02800 [Lentimicrobium sp.]|nr:hypothetical protein [Lentimicrobium sp.]
MEDLALPESMVVLYRYLSVLLAGMVVSAPLVSMVVSAPLVSMVVSAPLDHHYYSRWSGEAPVVGRSPGGRAESGPSGNHAAGTIRNNIRSC